MTREEILAMTPIIQTLAAPNCVLMAWGSWPHLPELLEVITACGFAYKGLGFDWIKTTRHADHIGLDGKGLHWGTGYHTRANSEFVLRSTRGEPRRLAEDIHQIVIAPVGEHSVKPEEVARRIERLYCGPFLELFARRERPGWTAWGNEIASPSQRAAS
jgi:N6-adenosine-specific RNA methylase IME4